MKKTTWTFRGTAVYHFSDEELEYLEGLAKKRFSSNRGRGIKNRKIDDTQSNKDLDFRSAKSEYAVAKLLELLPNEQTYFDEECKQGDLRLPGDAHLEVKCPSSRGYRFFVPSPKVERFTAAVGVLVWPMIGSEDMEIVGYTTRRVFREKADVITQTKKPFAVLDNEHLFDIEHLVEKVRERR